MRWQGTSCVGPERDKPAGHARCVRQRVHHHRTHPPAGLGPTRDELVRRQSGWESSRHRAPSCCRIAGQHGATRAAAATVPVNHTRVSTGWMPAGFARSVRRHGACVWRSSTIRQRLRTRANLTPTIRARRGRQPYVSPPRGQCALANHTPAAARLAYGWRVGKGLAVKAGHLDRGWYQRAIGPWTCAVKNSRQRVQRMVGG